MPVKYSSQITDNLSLGQNGSILVTGTTACTCAEGAGVFVAIQFVEDTVFASASGGLVAETEQLFPDDAGTGTLIDSNAGAASDSVTFPKGMTIYGRWTGFTLASGKVIAYVG
tara:strand:- start:1517 stop:1855 length:339 start_codon:yes stop_codon:yes gene_type:complete